MKKGLLLGFLLVPVVLLVRPLILNGSTVGWGENYIVPKGTAVESNLYAGGQQLTLTGNIFGDVVGGGGNVFLSNKIDGDALLFGATVNSISNVSGDLRIAGMTIVVSGEITGDLAMIGRSIRVIDDALIKGDLIAAGGDIQVSSPVSGSVRVSAANVTINGNVDGDVKVVADKLIIGPNAVINGSLQYKSVREAMVDKDAKIFGNTDFQRVSYSAADSNFLSFLWNSLFSVKLIALFVSSMILFAIGKRGMTVLANRGRSDILKNLLAGVLFLIGAPVSAVLLVMTVIGLPLSVAVIGLSIVLIIASVAFMPILTGSFIKQLTKKNDAVSWKVIALGSVVIIALELVPYLGTLLRTLIFLASVGAMIRIALEKLQHIRN